MNKKKIVIITSVIVLLILAILGASYAYYSATVKENNKTQTVIKTNELEIVYTGTQEINVEGIVPGDSFTKKFTIENTSNIPVAYNIYLEGITNEFNEDLVYILKDKDGTVIEEEVLPSTNTGKTYLITDIEIDASEIKEYEMTIEFKYSDKDQNKLQGKNFKATLGIDTTPVKIVKVVNEKIELDKLSSGDTVTKTFNVKNLSKETQSYDVSLSDVVSTYGDNLTYSLTKNGTEVISNEIMPSSDTTILESQIISANTTDEYAMTIKFDNTTAALEYILAAENDEFSANIAINYEKFDVTILCKRATNLHEEKCNNSDTTQACRADGYTFGEIIKYGNLKSEDKIKTGDAYDCDVNGDKQYSSETERFYYVTNINDDTASLIYYNNVSNGKPDNMSVYAYNVNKGYFGPKTAIEQLPTTDEWKTSLTSSIRNIKDNKGNIRVSSFDYANKAARLLTVEEVNVACGISVGNYNVNELKKCKFLFENTKYSDASLMTYGHWLENVDSGSSSGAWDIYVYGRFVNSNTVSATGYGVRPVIEVSMDRIEL